MSILMKLDGFRGALGYAGPAFDTFLRMDRTGFLSFDLVDLARADLSTVTTTTAFFFVNSRIHRDPKSQIPNPKLQTNQKFQYPMTKIRLEEKYLSRYALGTLR